MLVNTNSDQPRKYSEVDKSKILFNLIEEYRNFKRDMSERQALEKYAMKIKRYVYIDSRR